VTVVLVAVMVVIVAADPFCSVSFFGERERKRTRVTTEVCW